MNSRNSIFILTLFFATIVTTAFSQQFLDDGSMKLTEISTDKKYGFEAKSKSSIQVGTVENEYAYIGALRGPNGEQIQARRAGSCCGFKTKASPFGKGFLDVWEISYPGLEKSMTIYLNGYNYDAPKCPKGLTFKTGNK
jgi:hypothetical protein